MCLHIKQRADTLNDALYLANINANRAADDKYLIKNELEKTKAELEALKRELMEERGNRKSIEQEYANYREDVEYDAEYTGSVMGMLEPLHKDASNGVMYGNNAR